MSTLDAVTLSVLGGALSGIAQEMGTALVRSAYSSNIKERRDCSAALFDPAGRMVAQAEHIPVHLGAMPEAVAAVLAHEPGPGDVFVLNDPFSGGNHLPDITMVSWLGSADEHWGFAVTRAHHSDVGGAQPGSMPAGARDIYAEGLVIPPVRLVRGDAYQEEILNLILANTRTPGLREGDLRAQLAANQLARRRLAELIARSGARSVRLAFDEVISYAERRTRAAIALLPDGEYTARGEIEGDGVSDEDIELRVAVRVTDDRLTVDFTGTADAVPGNVNCPLSVTRSACYFAVRVLLPADIPANAGTYAPITVVAPSGSLVNARRPSAVVAGNVETSQRLADLVLDALAQAVELAVGGQGAGPPLPANGQGTGPLLPANGQGTMNNVNIGGSGWTYYETIGGGQGAAPGCPGASGVHVGMTNTLNTPIEAFEQEYPMRVERCELAVGSGGAGRWRGGDGVIRAIRVLAPATLSLLTDRRRHRPAGRAGGLPGLVGRNELNGAPLPPKVSVALAADDVVTIVTPGGGGYGPPVPLSE